MDERANEAIWRACGAAGPLRVAVSPPEPSELHVVPYPFVVVGRDERCDVNLDDALISRRHLLMIVIDGLPFAIDLGSREGTFWGGQSRKFGWIATHEPLSVGPFHLALDGLQPTAANPLGAATLNPLASWPRGRSKNSGELFLEVLSPPVRKTRWRISRVLTLVGRSDECKVRLMDTTVSAVHCCLVCTPMGLWVIDLLGREGITVNDKPARFARLADNDDLRVGRFLFRVRGEPPSVIPGRDAAWNSAGQAGPYPPSTLPATLAGAGSRAGASLAAFGPARSELSPMQGESRESLVMPIVDALRMIQQQDQSQHQQILMLIQSIFSMHGDQIRGMQSQLDYVLQALREGRTLASDPSLAARLAPPPRQNELTNSLRGATPFGVPEPRPEHKPRAQNSAKSAPDRPSKPKPRPEAARAAKPTSPPPRPAPEPAVEAPAEPVFDPNKIFHPEDPMHSIVCNRLDEIRKERMSLWEKILSMVGGS